MPDLLRRKALRKFFASDPLLANLDGLNDYDEDYNNPAHKVYKSAWDVTRGYLDKAEEALSEVDEDAPPEKTRRRTCRRAPDDGAEEMPESAIETAGELPLDEEEAAPVPQAPRRVSLRRRLEG